ncbi:MAG: glycosyltransferase family 2 protein [Conexivisphaerales archaeon]
MQSNLSLQEKKISIFIPVYVNSELLASLLEELLKDNYKNKEIFVIIDEPNQDSLNLFEKYKNRVFFILNDQRIGKANALNDAVNYSKGDILLFLDADIKLKNNDGAFLSKIVNEMHETDLLDIKKDIIRDSFISKMVNYEYISSNFVSYLYSRFAKRSVGINGAAFAIKREVFKEAGGFSKVVSEDFDLAIKVALKDRRFKFYDRLEVKTKSPRNWKDWFTQRKRWSIGVGLWLKDHWRELLKYVRKYPHLALLSFVILFPTFIPILLSYFLSNFLGYKLLNFIIMFLATKFPLLIAFPFIFSISLLILTSFMNFIISFILFLILFFLFAKKLNFNFSVLEFTIYYYFYQPFAFFVLIIGIITPFVYKKYKLDWKI